MVGGECGWWKMRGGKATSNTDVRERGGTDGE